MISDRFEDLAQSFRVFTEQYARSRELMLIDGPEAIGNVEHAISGILNAFSSLSDAMRADDKIDFNFYQSPLCCFVIKFRNARHHNHYNGIRSVYRFAQRQEPPVNYLLVNFPSAEEGGSFGEHYISWADINGYLLQHEANAALVRNFINAEAFERFATAEEFEESRIFINCIPLLFGAGCECVGHIAHRVEARSVESEAFLMLFNDIPFARFDDASYLELTSAIFKGANPR